MIDKVYGGARVTIGSFNTLLAGNSWENLDANMIYTKWADLEGNYSKQAHGLTHYTDALPAISGLAAFFSGHLKVSSNDYVAGLWKENLHKDLVWYLSHNIIKSTSPMQLLERIDSRPYLAPSWS